MTLSQVKKRLNSLISQYRSQLSDQVAAQLELIANDSTLTKKEVMKRISTLLLEHKELHNGFLDAYTKLMAEYKASLLKIEASAATLAVFEKEISKLFNTIWTMRDSKGVARAYTFDEAMGGLRQSLAKEVRSLLLGAYMSGDQVSFSKRAYGKKTARKLRTLTETWLYVVRNHTNLDIIKDNFPESWIFYHTQEDDRVDDVCSQCSDITLKKHYSPSEYPFECLPPLHFNCRCSIEPKID